MTAFFSTARSCRQPGMEWGASCRMDTIHPHTQKYIFLSEVPNEWRVLAVRPLVLSPSSKLPPSLSHPCDKKLGTMHRKFAAFDEKSGIFVLRPARMTDKGACPNVNREGLDTNQEGHDANREGTAANRKRNAATPRTAETQTAPRRVDEERSEQAGDESRRSTVRFSAVPPSVFRAAGGARRSPRVPCPLWGRNATRHC